MEWYEWLRVITIPGSFLAVGLSAYALHMWLNKE
jgi:hypothetical protein